jgi:glycosyltransferase involved in cell wall biosynthesis
VDILCFGSVSRGPCGVRDFGSRLAEHLRLSGEQTRELWFETDARRFGPSLRTAGALLRASLRTPRGSEAIWHYSVYAYSFRGIPMPGVLCGILLRLRSVRVVAILHEMALHWDVSRRQKVHSLAHRLALPLVLAGSDRVVVTTESRRDWLISRYKVKPTRVYVLPVFSNFPVPPPGSRDSRIRTSRFHARKVITVLGWAVAEGLEDLLFSAMATPKLGSVDLMLEMIGAPGPGSVAAERWMAAARREGQENRLRFTGVLRPHEFSARLRRADLVVLLFGDGPSSRHTLLAAALGNGCVTVSLDGADVWEVLRGYGAVEIVPRQAQSLGLAVVALLDDWQRRSELSSRARQLYDEYMSLPLASAKMLGLLQRPAQVNRGLWL